MITKLRHKIFWSLLASMVTILLVILVAVNIIYAVQNERENGQMMNAYLDIVTGNKPGNGNHGKAAGTVKALMDEELCAVQVDSEGTASLLAGSAVTADQQQLQSLVDKILSRQNKRGGIGSIRYLVADNNGTTVIVLSNYGLVGAGTARTILISICGMVAATLLFAFVASRLATRIVRPVEETLSQQKQFIADASHELKTPVTVINANIAVLEKEMGANKWLTFIKQQGDRLSALVCGMLEYISIDYDRETSAAGASACSFDAAAAISQAALPFESVAFEAGVECRFDIPAQAMAYGSAEDFKQIIGILLDNAIKHTEPHEKICLWTAEEKRRKKLREETVFSLAISNSGPTIPASALPYLFQRFYQVDPSRQHKDNSFGLGLAIAYSLAGKNNGTIKVASQNQLTVFTLEFPGRK